MENDNQNTRTIMGVLGALMILFLAGGIYFWVKNGQLTRQNDMTGQRADSLLSVKLQLEGDIQGLKNKLETAATEQDSLSNQLDEINNQLNNRTMLLSQVRRESAGRTRTIASLNRDISTLNTKRDSLENQMMAVTDKVNWLTDANSKLTTQNSELEPLKKQVSDMTEDLKTKVPRTALTADIFRVETVKGNQKETAKAKKVNTMMVSLNVPAEMGLTGTQDVYLSLTNDQQNAMMPAMDSSSVMVPGMSGSIPVQAKQSVSFGQTPQRLTFTITPPDGVKPGIYKAAVYTKDRYLGSTEFRLRDSFWFF